MDQGNGIEFVVNEQYENEKGVFTVLSIHKNEMEIRWEDGEEMRTDIELQRNIQARRQWEQLEKEKAALAAKNGRKSGTAKAAAVFKGFKETDFKTSASGTNWRGRHQLGGAVTHKIQNNKYNFNSWAFANKPEMHWLDTGHHKRQGGENRAKFFARVNTSTLFFGFSIIRPNEDSKSNENWDAFVQWLAHADNEAVVHTISLKNDMALYDKNHPESPMLMPIEGGWKVGGDDKKDTNIKLTEFLDALPIRDFVNLEIAKSLHKEDALSSGKEIAIDIAGLFSQLMPLYRGAWSPVS